jgi:hypothetical protein
MIYDQVSNIWGAIGVSNISPVLALAGVMVTLEATRALNYIICGMA